MVVGHAHPRIVEAINEAASRGTHFAVTTETAVAFGEEICRRFNLRDAPVRQLGDRGDDGRHPGGPGRHRARRGLQDRGLVPRAPRQRDVLDRAQRRPDGRPGPAGERPGVQGHGQGRGEVHRGRARSTTPTTSSGCSRSGGSEIACLIMEPAMMNIGIVVPQPGLPRSGCASCAPSTAWSSSSTRSRPASPSPPAARPSGSGCSPTWSASPRRSRAALPAAAFGGREDLMRLIERGVSQMGTYNGNPLVSHVGLVTLTEVLTPPAYEHFARLGTPAGAGLPGCHRPPRASPPTPWISAPRAACPIARRR